MNIAKFQLRNCIKSRNKNCNAGIPIWYVGNDNPESTKHIAEAQARGIGVIPLSRTKRTKNEKDALRAFNRMQEPCRGKVGGTTGKDCDEFPYLSTEQGGARSKLVSLKPISSADNQQAGRDLNNRFYSRCGVVTNQTNNAKSWFGVIAIPWLPQSIPKCR